MDVNNKTPFEFIAIPNYDKDGREVFTNIVKATYSLVTNQSIVVSEDQVPITMADEYWGEPGVTPVKYESDLAVFKPSTDLVLIGSACHYKGKRIKAIDVSFGISSIKKTATVKSDQAMTAIPLYLLENFGQKKSWFKSKQNENGVGFYPKKYKPRLNYAGTYDDSWLKERSPFLPKDFDYRFFQGAYPDLITKTYLIGNERVFAENVSLSGPIIIDLPNLDIYVETIFEKQTIEEKSVLDTVILEPDENRLFLVWRQMIPCHNMIKDIRGFKINMSSTA